MSQTPRHEAFYRSSRGKTIISVLVAVLALAGAGMLAGALIDPPDTTLTSSTLTTGGTGFPPPVDESVAADVLPQVEASSSPGGPLPSPSGTEPALPSPSPSASTGTTGGSVTVGGVLPIEVPAGWKLDFQSDDGVQAGFSDGAGSWIFVGVINVEPGRTAADVLATVRDGVLPPEYYTQLQVGDVTTQDPFGTLASLASMAYQAVWVDSQSSYPLFGNLWTLVRQDGKALVMTAETTPPELFQGEGWRVMVDPIVTTFANG